MDFYGIPIKTNCVSIIVSAYDIVSFHWKKNPNQIENNENYKYSVEFFVVKNEYLALRSRIVADKKN